jgi:hypothetical protein
MDITAQNNAYKSSIKPLYVPPPVDDFGSSANARDRAARWATMKALHGKGKSRKRRLRKRKTRAWNKM